MKFVFFRAFVGWLLAFFFIGAFPALSSARVSATPFYISPSGSDSNDGLSPSTPFRTIQKCAQVAVAGDSCLIRAGVYRETVTPVNSGTVGNPITFMPYNHENVTISGADVLTSWTHATGNIYRTTMAWTLNVRNDFQVTNDQIFIDGVMMPEARWPNIPIANLTHLKNTDKARAISATVVNTYTASYNDPALNSFPTDFWKGAKINFGPGWNTMHTTCDVTGSSPGSVSFQCNPDPGSGNFRSSWDTVSSTLVRPSAGNYYYLWGKYQALDAPGEWYRDSAANLYLWSPDSASPATHLVEAKKRLWAFDLTGKSHITLDGLNIFAATIKTNELTNHLLLQNLDMRYLWHMQEIPILWWTDATHGLELRGDDNILRDSHLTYTAASMIVLSGNHNQVSNNVIEDMGYMGNAPGLSARPYLVGATNQNQLLQNTIFDSGYFMIEAASGLNVKFNDLYNSHLQISDLGVIYANGVDGKNAQIAYNYVHDNWAELNEGLNYYGGHGIYLDDDTYNFLVYRNVIWNTTAPGIFLYGTNGTTQPDPKPASTAPSNRYIYNNTIDGTLGAAVKPNFHGLPQTLNGTSVKNNIATLTSGLTDPSLTTGNNYVGDGLYLDRNNRDYRLRADSPAVDAGLSLGSPYMDIPMIPVGTPDLGASEQGQPGFVAGATIRSQDLPSLNFTCAANVGSTVDCTVSNLPRGRKLPNDFQMRIGATGTPGQNCLTRMNYSTHTGTGVCQGLSTAGLAGVQSIMIQLSGGGWMMTGASVDLGTLTITSITPASAPSFGGQGVTVNGRRFDTAFAGYRTPINLNNPAARLYDYPMLVVVDTQALIAAGKMRGDCGDLRFNDSYGNLDYWLEEGCNTTSTRVWVHVLDVPAGASQIAMTYGVSGRTSASDGRRTFTFFDDFADSVVDTKYWWMNSGAGFSVGEIAGAMRIAGTTTSANQFNTFGFGLETSKIAMPAMFAIDVELSTVPPSTVAGFKSNIGSDDLSVYGGNGSFKDLGVWSGTGWISFGKSSINTALLNKKKLSVAYTGAANNRTVRWLENGDLATVLATRTGVTTPAYGYFSYGPDSIADFDARFGNIRIRNYTYPEPTASLGTETYSGVRLNVGGKSCNNISVATSLTLTCNVPSHATGSVDVVIVNSDGQSFTLPNGFTYTQSLGQLFLPLIWK